MEKKKCLLIDADSLAYYEMRRDTLEEGMQGIDGRIQHMLNRNDIFEFIICVSSKSFRYRDSKRRVYKGNRKKNEFVLLPSLLKYLEVEYRALKVHLMEADDMITYLQKSDPERYVIASADKDVLYQSVGRHYSYGKDEFVTVTEDEADYFLWKQMLMGDSTDNIEGVAGIGDVKSDKILKDSTDRKATVLNTFIDKYGILEGVNRFNETFNLVYMLKTKEDVILKTGEDFSEGISENIMNFEYLKE